MCQGRYNCYAQGPPRRTKGDFLFDYASAWVCLTVPLLRNSYALLSRNLDSAPVKKTNVISTILIFQLTILKQ